MASFQRATTMREAVFGLEVGERDEVGHVLGIRIADFGLRI